MKAIALPAYNRPEYFQQTLESMKDCEDWHLFIVFDKSSKTNVLIDIARSFESKFEKIHIEINNPRKGMVRNAWDNIQWTFNMGSEFTVCVEDDLWLSPDFFHLMNFYIKTFKGNPLACGAYGAQGGNTDGAVDEIRYANYFTGNGWGVFPECWEKWFTPFWFDSDLGMKHFGNTAIGNDWNVSGAFREYGVKMPFPALARSKHIGEVGGHFHPAAYKELCGHLVSNREHVVKEWKL